MMALRYFLMDDDAVIRKMLGKIIFENDLGEIVGEADDGLKVSISELNDVDVVFVDLLMPGRDGIETIKFLQEGGFKGRFIMISQVENKEMIGEAYQQGIDTFIQKPINRLEVLSVLKRVSEHLQLEQSLHSIRKSLSILDISPRKNVQEQKETNVELKIRQLMSQIGIAGDAGAADFSYIMKWLMANFKADGFGELPPLKKLYFEILQSYSGKKNKDLQKEVRAMEQRIRRMVFQSFTHLSSLGLTDYANPTFEYYGTRLFDFEEVRKRMRELDGGQKNTSCKINIRKFIAAFYLEMTS